MSLWRTYLIELGPSRSTFLFFFSRYALQLSKKIVRDWDYFLFFGFLRSEGAKNLRGMKSCLFLTYLLMHGGLIRVPAWTLCDLFYAGFSEKQTSSKGLTKHHHGKGDAFSRGGCGDCETHPVYLKSPGQSYLSFWHPRFLAYFLSGEKFRNLLLKKLT